MVRRPALALVVLLAAAGAAAADNHTPPPVRERTTPPPVRQTPALEVYLTENGAQTGPFTLDELRAKVAQGSLTARTDAWMSGMPDWRTAGEIDALSALFATDPAAPARAEAFDPGRFIVGRWQGEPVQTQVPFYGPATMTGTVEYRADGRVLISGQGVMPNTQFGGPDIVMRINGRGTYTIVPRTEKEFDIRLLVTMEMSGPDGLPPQMAPLNDVVTMRVIDENTVVDAQGNRSTRIR